MPFQLSSLARSGVIALAALSSLATAAPAGPLGPGIMPAVADSSANKPILVEMGEGRDHGPGYEIWPRRGYRGVGRIDNFDGGANNFRGRDLNDGDGRRYDDGDNFYVRDRRYYRRHYRDNYYRPRSGIYFGLGVAPAYRYGDPYYDDYYGDPYYSAPVYRPRVIQRRVYRSGGSAHVQWCYNRYRSYRAWDNTFQPYHGPRQLCYSPYS